VPYRLPRLSKVQTIQHMH